jgi:hypothetical protein
MHMPDDPDSPADTVLYFLTLCTFVNETPADPDAPIGSLPVFKTLEAARKYGHGMGEIGEILFIAKKQMN